MAAWITQPSARDDLKFISQPPGRDLTTLKGYTYHESAGKGSIVYIVDYGADFDHQEFCDIRNQWEWLFPFPKLAGVPAEGRAPKVHGTPMLSKITGKICGISKNVKAIIVRVPTAYELGTSTISLPEVWVRALECVLADLKTRQLGEAYDKSRTAIINMSFNLKEPPKPKSDAKESKESQKAKLVEWQAEIDDLHHMLARMESVLDELMNRGALPITGAGNGWGPIDGWPALFGQPSNPSKPSILVAGGVELDGNLWGRTQTAKWGPQVSAPAADIYRALLQGTKHTDSGTHEVWRPYEGHGNGTSESSAQVAGLAAYLQQVPSLETELLINKDTATPAQRAMALKDLIIKTAWPRLDDGTRDQSRKPRPSAIWNSVDLQAGDRDRPWSRSKTSKIVGSTTTWGTRTLTNPPPTAQHYRFEDADCVQKTILAKKFFKCPPDQNDPWRFVVQIFSRHLESKVAGDVGTQLSSVWPRGTAWITRAANIPGENAIFLLTAAHNLVRRTLKHDDNGKVTTRSNELENALTDAIYIVAYGHDQKYECWVDRVSIMDGYLSNDEDLRCDGAALHLKDSTIPPSFFKDAPIITYLPPRVSPYDSLPFFIAGFPGSFNEYRSLEGLYISGIRGTNAEGLSMAGFQPVNVVRNSAEPSKVGGVDNGTITFSDTDVPTLGGMSGSPALMLVPDKPKAHLVVVGILQTDGTCAPFTQSSEEDDMSLSVTPNELLRSLGAGGISWAEWDVPDEKGDWWTLKNIGEKSDET
ncbi:peptidase S8/S53 domain-containing protein [Xylariaceae sp. FL1019]|nr:peptidase S8/S53 domain-containing protein [Xylariaceae sp. FL1019]